MFVPGFRFSLENGVGDGVGSSSLFYATRPRVLPQGIDKQELVWHMGVGEGRNWSWVSELKYRKFRQRETVWQDSLRGWVAHPQGTDDKLEGLDFFWFLYPWENPYRA